MDKELNEIRQDRLKESFEWLQEFIRKYENSKYYRFLKPAATDEEIRDLFDERNRMYFSFVYAGSKWDGGLETITTSKEILVNSWIIKDTERVDIHELKKLAKDIEKEYYRGQYE